MKKSMLSSAEGKIAKKKEFSSERVFRLRIYLILILVSGGLIFGRIMATDSIPDRTIQEYRLAQIPKTLREKASELRQRGISENRIKAECRRVGKRLLADAKKERPTLSANDRSRWLTIRALVEPESRVYRYLPLDRPLPTDGNDKGQNLYSAGQIKRNSAIGSPDHFDEKAPDADRYVCQWVPYAIDKAMETPGWETIDMVKHGLANEKFDPSDPFSGYLYSSKPTLLPTLMAIPYWILYQTTGLSLKENPFLMTRILLVLYNLIPLMIGWFFMARLIERFGGTEEGDSVDAGFVDIGADGNGAATIGPQIAISAGEAVRSVETESVRRNETARQASDWAKIIAVAVVCFATFLSTFAVTLNNHLPGVVSIIIALDAVSRILADRHPKKRYFILAALFGSLAVACEIPSLLIASLLCLALLWRYPVRTLLISGPCALAVIATFFGTNYLAHGTIRQAYSHKRDHVALARTANPDSDGALVTTFDPDDWYVYRFFPAGAKKEAKNARLSYWSDRQGIDRGEASRSVYALHALIGHHGLFSLTPVWIFSVVGLFFWLFRRKREENDRTGEIRLAGGAILLITLFFFVFYLTRDQGDRNYGGMTCGLRWFFPLIPFWILSMLPVLTLLGRSRIGRGTVLLLVFLSAMSVSYPLWNPWSSPWMMNLMAELGWIGPF